MNNLKYSFKLIIAMKNILYKLLLFCTSLFFIACNHDDSETPIEPISNKKPIEIQSFPQKIGNATKGYQYLISGDYMSSGIPYDVFIRGFGTDNNNLLNRTGDNAAIPPEYTAINAPNGVRVVAPNCIQCHAGKINNTFIIGLGNHSYDFTINRAEQVPIVTAGINLLYGVNSKEAEAFEILRRSLTAIGSSTVTKTVGSNPADKVTQVLSTYKDKHTLEWIDNPTIQAPSEIIPTDVPAWWLLKKKNAMFYHAIGRHDFTKYAMVMSFLTLKDSAKANEINKNFEDVLAYIYSIEAPKYPFTINNTLANRGKIIFENNCSKCHGTYGNNESYPNLLIPLEIVKTDPALSNNYNKKSTFNDYFFDWGNNGWLGSNNGLKVVSEGGYVAQPLHGIWATAPYFHNGSVPTLENVLNSSTRPTYWSRTFESTDYNKDKVGWNYNIETSKVDKKTYDTTLFAHGNGGHTFGDSLSDEDRKALIEYLKTL